MSDILELLNNSLSDVQDALREVGVLLEPLIESAYEAGCEGVPLDDLRFRLGFDTPETP